MDLNIPNTKLEQTSTNQWQQKKLHIVKCSSVEVVLSQFNNLKSNIMANVI